MLSEELKKVLENYNEGLKLYRERKFNEALKYFEEALKLKPDDGPSKLYVERCKMLIDNPPPEDWDGVFTMTTK
jgi:tetratricopeptide (TPR) repeat protein